MRKKRKKPQKNKKFNSKMQASLLLVFCVIILTFFALILRLFYLDEQKGEKYEKRVLSQESYVSNVIPYKRGNIVDRKGNVLAQSIKVYNLVLDPKQVLEEKKQKNEKTNEIIIETPYKEATVKALAACFGLEESGINQILEEKKSKSYVILQKKVPQEKVDIYNEYVDSLKEADKDKKSYIQGIFFEPDYIRKYPLSTVASHVIGFTNSGNQGNGGIEGYYNEELNGLNGREYGYFDSELNLKRTVKPATNGNKIVTTLDVNIQRIVEDEINKYNEEVGTEHTGVIVANPATGEILAMSTYPQFDLNDPRNLEPFYTKAEINKMTEDEKFKIWNEEIWRNYCISSQYEPGSTFKPVTVAAALEEGLIQNNSTFLCKGYEMISGRRIGCHETGGHRVITLSESLMYSCNAAMMQIAKKEGRTLFDKYQRNFGFGSVTGIDLPGEATGDIFQPEQLNPVELATSSFGQSLNVTMVQMVAAISSVINDGKYYKPHVVKRIENDKGAIVQEFEPILMKETVSKKTSELIRDYLYDTVEGGTAKAAKIEGYTIGGKTGTAQIHPIRKDVKERLVSFIGFTPVDEPKLLVYVVVDRPHVEYQGDSKIATSMANRILKKSLPFTSIYKSNQKVDKTNEKKQS